MSAKSRATDDSRLDSDARHQAAVARSLSWADDAAARGDHTDALAWLGAIEAIGEQLTPEYHAKRETWQALASAR